jgi:hypothetical protein
VKRLVLALLALLAARPLGAADRGSGLRLVYGSHVLGELEPCG